VGARCRGHLRARRRRSPRGRRARRRRRAMTWRGRAPLVCAVIASFVAAVAEAEPPGFGAQGLAGEEGSAAPPAPRTAPERPLRGLRVRLDGVAAVVGAEAPGPSTVLLLRSDVELRARLALLRSGSLEL